MKAHRNGIAGLKTAGEKKDITIVILVCMVIFLLALLYLHYQRKKTEDPLILYIKQLISPLSPRVESLHFISSNRSYTRNKKLISLCLKRPDGTYYDLNTLVYVAIHELAHALYKGNSKNHGKRWRQDFQRLLQRAEKIGIYNSKLPIEEGYCGT